MSFSFDLHSAAVSDSHLPCHAPTMPFFGHSTARLSLDGRALLCRGLEKNGMVGAWHGHSMASVNKTRPHFVNQMGNTHSKPLAARHGRERHGHGMLCVNRSLSVSGCDTAPNVKIVEERKAGENFVFAERSDLLSYPKYY